MHLYAKAVFLGQILRIGLAETSPFCPAGELVRLEAEPLIPAGTLGPLLVVRTELCDHQTAARLQQPGCLFEEGSWRGLMMNDHGGHQRVVATTGCQSHEILVSEFHARTFRQCCTRGCQHGSGIVHAARFLEPIGEGAEKRIGTRSDFKRLTRLQSFLDALVYQFQHRILISVWLADLGLVRSDLLCIRLEEASRACVAFRVDAGDAFRERLINRCLVELDEKRRGGANLP